MSNYGSFDALGYFASFPQITERDAKDSARLANSKMAKGFELSQIADSPSLMPFAALIHELAHFFKVASTPFGLFWTRSLLAQSSVFGIIRHAVSTESTVKQDPLRISIPLIRCSSCLPMENAEKLVTGIARLWNQLEVFRKILLDPYPGSLRSVLETIIEPLMFMHSFGYSDCADYRMPMLGDPELPNVLSNLSPDEAAYPQDLGGLTTRQLLETHARLIEQEALGMLGSAKEMEDFVRASDVSGAVIPLKLMGGYHNQTKEYSVEVQQTILALIDLALFTPLDAANKRLWSTVFLWEDIHPAHRYVIGARASKTIGLLEDLDDYESYCNRICEWAGWLRPREIIQTMLPVLDSSPSIYDQFLAACFRVRLEAPCAFMLNGNDFVKLPVPICVYRDTVVHNFSEAYPRLTSEKSVWKLMTNYLRREFARQILFENKISNPELGVRLGIDPEQFIQQALGVSVAGR